MQALQMQALTLCKYYCAYLGVQGLVLYLNSKQYVDTDNMVYITNWKAFQLSEKYCLRNIKSRSNSHSIYFKILTARMWQKLVSLNSNTVEGTR
jgi:hypothetical protein